MVYFVEFYEYDANICYIVGRFEVTAETFRDTLFAFSAIVTDSEATLRFFDLILSGGNHV